MDREKLIEAADKFVLEFAPVGNFSGNLCRHLMADFTLAQLKLLVADNAKWVPVEERQPTLGGPYIVTIDWLELDNSDPNGWVAYWDNDIDAWKFCGEKDRMPSSSKVIAWMEHFPKRYERVGKLQKENAPT